MNMVSKKLPAAMMGLSTIAIPSNPGLSGQ
jgi:hypothetical protein